jgi:hypothetical protein
MKAGGSEKKVNRKPIGIRLDTKILDLLAQASSASGASRTEIIEECVKAYASEYVALIFERRKMALDDYLKTSKSNNQKPQVL